MLLDIAIIVFLMVAAILLILAEIFLLPGITLAGIGGAIFAIGGVVFAYTVGMWVGHLTLSLSIIAFGVIFAWLLRSRSFNKIALKTDIDSKLTSSRDLGIEPGDEGITLSRLAPFCHLSYWGPQYFCWQSFSIMCRSCYGSRPKYRESISP